MKGCACAIITVLNLISFGSTLPIQNGMLFYRTPNYYNPYQQAMLVHYAQQPFGRSSDAGTSVFAAGDSISAGTYLREQKVPQAAAIDVHQQQQASDDNEDVQAIAEAYPDEPFNQPIIITADDAVQNQDKEQVNEVISLPEPVPYQPTVLNDQANLTPASVQSDEQTNIAEVLPPTTPTPTQTTTTAATVDVVPSKKKVHVALDVNDDDEDDDDDDNDYVQFVQKPKKPSRKGSASPENTFFPVSFGRAAGGTIAIANAYSAGKGLVRSHAIAYGASAPASRQLAAKHHIHNDE